MCAVILDPKTGRPESNVLLGPSGLPAVLEEAMESGWHIRGLASDHDLPDYSTLPDSIKRDLELSRENDSPFAARAGNQSWRETLYSIITDATPVTSPAVATILVPDFTLPQNYLYQGRTLKYTLFGHLSSPITTPGTFTMSLRWGGVGGIVLATSGAYAPDPTAASTNVTWQVEWYVVCRSVGTAGSARTFGHMSLGDYDDASTTTLANNLNANEFPDNVTTDVAIDTTTSKALSPCVTPSLTTGSVTAKIAILEALN